MWDQLPELILTQIFDYLDRTDRASVSQVCQSWNRTLSSPVLWRSVTVLIDRDLRGDFPLAGELAAKYGQHMRSLELAFSRPYISPRQIRIRRNIQAEAGADFLAIVRAKDVQLRQLTLTNWVFGYKWGNRGILLSALANFLRYLRLLGRFHALTLLKLDYPALSNDALDALASGASKTLKYLYISVRDSDSRQHMVADAAWRNLVLACPDLTVSYTIVNISHYEDMCYLLLPSVPLAKFHMFSGHVWDQSRSRNFRNTIGLIITQYTNTLVEVMLQLRNNRESLDDLLVSMLIRCKRLTRLQYDGIIRSLETLREICQLQAERKTHFRTIHVKPRNVNIQNRAILNDINYRYDRKMHEQGVDFRIEDITSILFFY
ncbi:F-box only protein 39 [Acromyrmex echinatior]|uniref:F-box only protein 39 n=1 Tax=Acromyrmex echinatior TaxID=103372 RepID=F4WBR3_ACREC|nr:F-box only protein 39 [Acromyrmex echinatior]